MKPQNLPTSRPNIESILFDDCYGIPTDEELPQVAAQDIIIIVAMR